MTASKSDNQRIAQIVDRVSLNSSRGLTKLGLKKEIANLLVEARLDEVRKMPHERRPEQHEFEQGKFNGNCDCYKGRRIKALQASKGANDE